MTSIPACPARINPEDDADPGAQFSDVAGYLDDAPEPEGPPDPAPAAPPLPEDTGPPLLTDVGNAMRFARDHGDIVRHVHPWKKWLIWDGARWKPDDTGAPTALAKKTVSRLFAWAKHQIDIAQREGEGEGDDDAKARISKIKKVLDHAFRSQHIQRLKAMVELARSEPGIPILPDALDTDPWVLNVANGTLDLRTGKLQPHRQADYLTKFAPVMFDLKATAPTWERFLAQIFDGDMELVDYLQRLVGYWLTGRTTEHALPVFHGVGANGKSTVMGAIFDLLGRDYSGKASRDLLTSVKGDRHPTSLAWLHGKRFAACIETAEGARLDEALIKELTGGDAICARRMREDFWEFRPTHKIALVTNHKPQVRGTDHAIWRRLRLVPFEVCFAEKDQDKSLPDKLRAELSGILNWALAGCLAWQRHGLADPAKVLAATADYRSEQDRLAEFLADRCIVNPELRAKATEIYTSYRAWSDAHGERSMTATQFGMALAERNISRDAGKRWYIGIAQKQEEE